MVYLIAHRQVPATMPSPEKSTKRRKLNNEPATPSSSRNLDFFFGKQQPKRVEQIQSPTSRNENHDDLYENPEDHGDAKVREQSPIEKQLQSVLSVNEKSWEQQFSDEEYARRLQAQFDEEDRAGSSGVTPVAVTSEQQISSEPITEEPVAAPFAERTSPTLAETKFLPTVSKQTLSLQSTAVSEDKISDTIPFDENPLTFDPGKYLPALKKQWDADGGDVPFALLTRCFVLVNSTTSRIKIVDTLVNFLRVIIEGEPTSLLPAVWLTTNAISPPYISLELGLGGSAISKGLKKAFGLDNSSLKALYDKHGDPGDVAAEAKKKQSFTLRKPKPLSIKGIYQSLAKIANSKGQKSQEFKQQIVDRLMQDCQGPEQGRYLVRTLCQHLRIGAVKTTMLIALSRAFLLSKPPNTDFAIRSQSDLAKLDKQGLAEVWAPAEELVKASFARRPNYNDLVPCLLDIGISDELLVRCGLAMHIPLRPMLGSITRDLGEMLTKLQGRDFSCEYKYDGQRAQVHCDNDGKVSIFSRHLEVMTDKYPDLVALVPQIRGDGVRSFILEGEVVAIDSATGDLKGFQTLTNRARKDVQISSVTIDVCLFSFDLMYLNGESLLDRPFRERRSLLRSMFIETPHKFTWVKSIDATSADSETVLEFFKSATDIKCEGIMVKVLDNVVNPDLVQPGDEVDEFEKAHAKLPPTPTKTRKKTTGKKKAAEVGEDRDKGSRRKALLATYEPDKRLDSWLKVKKDYDSSVFDTLDLIPVGAWHGSGRKAKWWSPILLAVRNPETGALEAVTKCISGFTDKFYQANKEKYEEGSENIISRPSYVEYPGSPDVWFEPQEVWEMAFADITLSPTYLAAIGLVSEDRGLSTRFPRFLKVREDKSIDEASTNDFLASLWRKQEAKVKADGGPKGADADVDDDDDGNEQL